jgi:DNA-binding NtrC family response regulator
MTTILHIDDNENHCMFYKQELGLEGYDIITANNWNEALDKIQEQSLDLIIVGSCTPEMDRIYALIRFYHKYKYIPIILNSSYSKYNDRYLSRIADAYIVKSSDLTKLKNKIEELLSKELKIPTTTKV